ncbi:hypothetical protein G6F31_019901 [Rhizopus arrhizus]|nr:hypothetical protein G6F31_019901 [Rhizopus arrhizus]
MFSAWSAWARRCVAAAPRGRCPTMAGAWRWGAAASCCWMACRTGRARPSLLGAMDDASDGTVALAETRLPGLSDHCVVRTSHSGLVVSPDAARQTAYFLRHGQFDHSRDAAAA